MKKSQLLLAIYLFAGLACAFGAEEPNKFVKATEFCRENFARFVTDPAGKMIASAKSYDAGSGATLAAQYVYQFSKGRYPSVPMKNDGSFFATARAFVDSEGNRLLRLLAPLPLPAKISNDAEAIFALLWRDPKFWPNEEQIALLKKNNAYDYFLGRKKFLQANPYVKPLQNSVAYTKAGLLTLGAAAALNQAYDLSHNRIDVEDFTKRPAEDENGKPVVQLFVETTPLPHTALRIGNKVYSYGQQFITTTGVAEYLGDSYDVRIPKPFKNLTSRALRITNLNLSDAEVAKLQRDLELNTGKVYDNRTLVNDCATMVKRVLEKNTSLNIPSAIDASPSLSSTYLSLRSTFGDTRVGKTELLVTDKSNNEYALSARNAYIAMLEAKAIWALAPMNAAERVYVDLTKKNDELQYYLPEVQKAIDAWKVHAAEKVKGELSSLVDMDSFSEQLSQAKSAKERAQKIESAKKLLSSVTGSMKEEAEATIDFAGADLKDLVIAVEKKEQIQKVHAELLGKLNALER